MSHIDKLIEELCPDSVEYVEIGTFAKESKTRNSSHEVKEVRSITNTLGLVRTDDFFENSRTSKDTSNYKIVAPGMLPSRTRGYRS